MKILPLNNNFQEKKSSTITLYMDCCCCCCCCILAPIGTVLAERRMVKKYNIENDSFLRRGILNFFFALISGVIVYFFIGFSEILVRSAENFLIKSASPMLTVTKVFFSVLIFLKLNDFLFFLSCSSLIYFLLLFLYSFSWLKDVSKVQRFRTVLYETLISLLYILIFSIITVVIFIPFISIIF